MPHVNRAIKSRQQPCRRNTGDSAWHMAAATTAWQSSDIGRHLKASSCSSREPISKTKSVGNPASSDHLLHRKKIASG